MAVVVIVNTSTAGENNEKSKRKDLLSLSLFEAVLARINYYTEGTPQPKQDQRTAATFTRNFVHISNFDKTTLTSIL